jgi:hypothetical protein
VLTLANGSVVRENVRQTLRLSNPPDLSASMAESVVAIKAEASTKERARQIDAEAAQVVTQLVATRFGSQGLQASLLDPAHVAEQTSPTPVRNLLVCGLLGLLAGGLLYAYRRTKQHAVPLSGGPHVDPSVERRLKQRIDEVTKREKALARRAGELAKGEAGLVQRQRELDRLEATARELQARPPEPPPAAKPEPEPPPEPPPAPIPDTLPVTRAGSWNVDELERVVGAQGDATPEQRDEWATYLFLLREHAAADGSLPRQFEGLVEEVFGSLTV